MNQVTTTNTKGGNYTSALVLIAAAAAATGVLIYNKSKSKNSDSKQNDDIEQKTQTTPQTEQSATKQEKQIPVHTIQTPRAVHTNDMNKERMTQNTGGLDQNKMIPIAELEAAQERLTKQKQELKSQVELKTPSTQSVTFGVKNMLLQTVQEDLAKAAETPDAKHNRETLLKCPTKYVFVYICVAYKCHHTIFGCKCVKGLMR